MSQLPNSIAPIDPRPWYMSGGATTATRGEIQRRARSLLESDDYQASLKRRILSDTLPPAVETMMYYYAFGKPMEQLQITLNQTREDLSGLGVAELIEKAREIQTQLEEARKIEEFIPAQYRVEP